MKATISKTALEAIKAMKMQIADGFICRANISAIALVNNVLEVSVSSYSVNISEEGWNKLKKYPKVFSISLCGKTVKERDIAAIPVLTVMDSDNYDYDFLTKTFD